MKNITAIITLSSLLCAGCVNAAPTDKMPSWSVGYWAQTQDEDGRPGDDTLEIRPDGAVISYDANCNALAAGTLHLHNGNFYATWIARKGPISMIYAPSADHKSLTFTSPRTGNNAVYEPASSCIPAEG
jgi:hypothetical protein